MGRETGQFSIEDFALQIRERSGETRIPATQRQGLTEVYICHSFFGRIIPYQEYRDYHFNRELSAVKSWSLSIQSSRVSQFLEESEQKLQAEWPTIPLLSVIKFNNSMEFVKETDGVIIAELGESQALYTEGLASCTGLGMKLRRKNPSEQDENSAFFAIAHLWDFHVGGLRMLVNLVRKDFFIDSVAVSVDEKFAKRMEKSLRGLVEKGIIPAEGVHFDNVRTDDEEGFTTIGGGIILTRDEGGFLVEEPRLEHIPGKEELYKSLPPLYHLREGWSWKDNQPVVVLPNPPTKSTIKV